jgi:hypothetical protein
VKAQDVGSDAEYDRRNNNKGIFIENFEAHYFL